MKKIIGIGALVVVVLVVVGVLGYLGYIPGIAGMLGWNSPKDLGVLASIEDYNAAAEKLGRQRLELTGGSGGDPIVFEGSHPVTASFSQEEMTATWQSRDFAGNPFSDNGQIRINEDDTVEISGALNIPELLDFIESRVTIDEETKGLLDKAGFIKGDVSFYAKGTFECANNNWNIDIAEAKLGIVSIPVDQIPMGALEDAARTAVNSIAGLDVESLTIDNGKMNFKGTYPDKTYYAPAAD